MGTDGVSPWLLVRGSARPVARLVAPTGLVLVNAIAFFVLRPGVPDLWAARARGSAVAHGVGLSYWFSWFGGVTPGKYSVVTPYLCAVIGTELVASMAAVITCGLATHLLRDTRRPVASTWLAAVSVVINLWSGRVPFLVGCALGVATLICVNSRRRLSAATLAALTVLASPVAGVFVGLGLSGMLFVRRARPYRATIVLTVLFTAGTLIWLAVVFGTPGPEPLPLYQIGQISFVLVLMMLSAPPDYLRVTLAVSAAAAVVAFTVPNGMGANLARLALFCLPPAAVALSGRGSRTLTALTVPIVVLSVLSSASALLSATNPSSSASYYAALARELDALHAVGNHRLELVDASHAAYAVLLDHAVLARGWETQEDLARNGILHKASLDARSYQAWLDENAVGYVAVDGTGHSSPEAEIIRIVRPAYLREVWSSAHWHLYDVRHPTPIVAGPAVLAGSRQSAMIVRVPCACRASLRVRWSKFLAISPYLRTGTPEPVEDTYHPTLMPDRLGWTTLTTNRPGTYILDGSL